MSVYSEPVQSGAYVANVVNEVDNHLVEVIVTEGMVLQQLELLSESKSPGPDNILAKLLRKYSKHFSKPLLILFTLSLKLGILPSSWKIANVIPIYKKTQNPTFGIIDQ